MKIPVSVIIAAYQAERYIAESIESILNQSIQPEEIIVVNDGSTDGTMDIVKQYPQVTIVENDKNLGSCATLNHGLRVASMPWISFLDADDLWVEHRLKMQWEAVLEKGDDAAAFLFFGHTHSCYFLPLAAPCSFFPSSLHLIPTLTISSK